MEKRPVTPETSDETEENAPSTLRSRALNTFRKWVYFRDFGENMRAPGEFEADTTEKGKKKKKFRDWLSKRVFGKMVSKETVDADKVEKPAEGTLLSGLVSLETADKKPDITSAEAPEESAPAKAESAPRESEGSAKEPELSVPAAESPEGPTPPKPPEAPVSVPESGGPRGREPIEVPLDRTHEHEILAPVSTHTKEVERVVEHQNGSAAVLVGAEFLARRRHDKRLEKEIKHDRQEIKKLKANQERLQYAKQKEKVEYKPVEAPFVHPRERAPEPRPTIERTPVQPRPEVQVPREPQSVKEILHNRLVEQPIIERAAAKKQAEALAHSHYENEHLQAEQVLQQVEQIAEKNVAIEGLFERRHEMKDEDKQFQAQHSDGANQGVAGGYAQRPSHLIPADLDHQYARGGRAQAIKQLFEDERYKKAAVGGAWAAIIMVAFLIALLVVK